ncbi:hypothetical protein [Nostoc sp. CHAB 5715]|uniref:hypothetical protein n=1 Tax=Nostoc sp. CHAB 5715 TaxID=2780400 RepID=UPI001E5D63A2|nr:hypothetical protein [Nostoc sp. CHAB 5715]MCC5622400.1 hypothetical protein [Nostoc sp. CHAB 5715]
MEAIALAPTPRANAPEPLTPVEISFYHHEYYAGDKLIASISYDDNHLTQRWVVMVEGVEKFRANTWARCHRFIQWHYKDGTLNTPPIPLQELTFLEISYYDQEVHIGDYHTDSYLVASISYDHDNYEDLYWRVMINAQEIYRDITPALCYEYIKQQYQQGTLPVQEQLPEEVCTTGNEIMVQIFTECEKFGFDILDDGIYNGDAEGGKLRKLGKVGQTDGGWWFTRAADETQQRIPCDSALDAVWWLSMVDVVLQAEPSQEYLQYRPLEQLTTNELQQLLDRPFDELTPDEWEQLREYEPYLQLVAA